MFDVWTNNLGTFFLVYLLLGLVNGVLGAATGYALYGVITGGTYYGIPSTTGVPVGNLGLLAVYLIVAVVASVVVTSIVAGGMAEYSVRRFRGETMSVGDALRRGVSKFLSVLGALVLLVVIVVLIVLVPILVALPWALAVGGPGAVAAVILGVLAGLVIAIYVAVSLLLFAPAIMMENATALGGLRRSWRLTRGHMASLFGALLVVAIIAAIIDGAIGLAGLFFPGASIVTSAFASGITGSWVVIFSAVAYDLLTRPHSAVPPSAPGVLPPLPPQGQGVLPPAATVPPVGPQGSP